MANGQLLINIQKNRLSLLRHNVIRGLLSRVLTRFRRSGRPRNDNITQACKVIGVQPYMELVRNAVNKNCGNIIRHIPVQTE